MVTEVAGTSRLLFPGVFCTFAPIGCLLAMINEPPGGWLYGVIMAAICGLIAVAWSYAFVMRRLWLLAIIAPGQSILPWMIFRALAVTGVLDVGMGMNPTWRRALVAGMALAFMVSGFVLGSKVVRRVVEASVRARTELDVARRMHEAIVPPITLSAGAVEVFGRSEPSSEMGGDLIDAAVRDGEVDVFLADVSGHGVGAGVVMGMVKSSIRTLIRTRPSLEGLVTELNAVLSELTTSDMFATFACVRLTDGTTAEFALAGHLPILHFIAATGQVRELPNDRLPLGIDADEKYLSGRVPVATGDTLAMFTDGLVEVMNSQGRQLGLAALKDTFGREARSTLPALHTALLGAARSHGEQNDDQSVVLIRVG